MFSRWRVLVSCRYLIYIEASFEERSVVVTALCYSIQVIGAIV